MPHGAIVRVTAPIDAYDTVHAELMKTAGDVQGTGLISHVARATPDGFEVIEIWETKQQADAFNRDVVGPAMQRLGVADGPEPEVIEFEPHVVMAVQVHSSENAATDSAMS